MTSFETSLTEVEPELRHFTCPRCQFSRYEIRDPSVLWTIMLVCPECGLELLFCRRRERVFNAMGKGVSAEKIFSKK